jgi:hypothetical protein
LTDQKSKLSTTTEKTLKKHKSKADKTQLKKTSTGNSVADSLLESNTKASNGSKSDSKDDEISKIIDRNTEN